MFSLFMLILFDGVSLGNFVSVFSKNITCLFLILCVFTCSWYQDSASLTECIWRKSYIFHLFRKTKRETPLNFNSCYLNPVAKKFDCGLYSVENFVTDSVLLWVCSLPHNPVVAGCLCCPREVCGLRCLPSILMN